MLKVLTSLISVCVKQLYSKKKKQLVEQGETLVEIYEFNKINYEFPSPWHTDSTIYLDKELCSSTENRILLFLNIDSIRNVTSTLQVRVRNVCQVVTKYFII